MIVEAFKDSLEIGLEKPSQIVVSIELCTTSWSVKAEVRLHFADLNVYYFNLDGDYSQDQ
jgi:hypothetical protein